MLPHAHHLVTWTSAKVRVTALKDQEVITPASAGTPLGKEGTAALMPQRMSAPDTGGAHQSAVPVTVTLPGASTSRATA